MEELIGRVATAAEIGPDQARQAVELVFAFLKKEAPGPFAELAREMPEVDAAAEAGAATPKGGFMSGLMGMMGGGGLIGLAGQLTGIGLGMSEMSAVGREIFAYGREKAGDEKIEEIAAAIPGLKGMI